MKNEVVRQEDELISIILKYRTLLSEGEYLDIEERERDRRRLNFIYEELHSINQKILDSKCYLQLGKIQKEQTARFLADDTTPQQRMEMIAYVLRSLTRPVLFVHGKTVLPSFEMEVKKETEDVIQPPLLSEPPDRPASSCRPLSVSPEEIRQIASHLKELVGKYRDVKQWKGKITVPQAEMISQMMARGDIQVSLPTAEKSLDGALTSMVLKEA